MRARPKLLDLCCGAGGASMGYAQAGFDVTGVDLEHHRGYPFRFSRADAMEVSLDGFDVVHVSPPCQRYSRSRNLRADAGGGLPDLIGPFRDKLEKWGGPFVIENVDHAPFVRERSIMLCGRMFGLHVYRHRGFESNVLLMTQPHHKHPKPVVRKACEIMADPDAYLEPTGHFACVKRHAQAMGIDWRMTREELAQAIPPAFTRYIGGQLLYYLSQRRDG